MNYAKAVEAEYARLIQAGPRPVHKGPKFSMMQKRVTDLMVDGRERTAGDVALAIGCNKDTAGQWLGKLAGLKGGGLLESQLYLGARIYWLARGKTE
jgi:hypothetical protein